MRLTCPNCGAQYEVEGNVIPDAGRDVQCSNCGHTWFQRQAQQENEIAEEQADVAATQPDTVPDDGPDNAPTAQSDVPDAQTTDAETAPEPKRQELDEDVATVLREEAKLESSQRAGKAEPDQTPPPAKSSETPNTVFAERSTQLHPTGDGASDSKRKGLLPDIEEINSTLAATSTTPAPEDDAAAETRRRSGFRRGFAGSVLVLAIMALVYVFAPDIADAVPGTATSLAVYVDWINALRVSVDGVMQGAVSRLTALLAQISGDPAG